MKYLLDTCVVSELMKPHPSPKVVAWFESVDDGDLYMSSVVIGEIRKGILLLPDSRRKTIYEKWFKTEIEDAYSGRTLPYDSAAAKRWAKIIADAESSGHPRPLMDSLVAAIALEHGMTVVTRNVSDMEYTGVPVFNPFE